MKYNLNNEITLNNLKSERRIYNNKLRRQRQLRKNIFLFLFSIIFILTLSIGGSALGAKAQNKEEVILYKYYTNIVVQYNETLNDIANKYYCEEKYKSKDDYIIEVLQLNRMFDANVTPGTYLVVPYYSSEFK